MTTPRARAAQSALEIPLFIELLDDLEAAAINQCVNAELNDDVTRRNAAAEARSIRKIRSKLEAISREGQSQERKPAPA